MSDIWVYVRASLWCGGVFVAMTQLRWEFAVGVIVGVFTACLLEDVWVAREGTKPDPQVD